MPNAKEFRLPETLFTGGKIRSLRIRLIAHAAKLGWDAEFGATEALRLP